MVDPQNQLDTKCKAFHGDFGIWVELSISCTIAWLAICLGFYSRVWGCISPDVFTLYHNTFIIIMAKYSTELNATFCFVIQFMDMIFFLPIFNKAEWACIHFYVLACFPFSWEYT